MPSHDAIGLIGFGSFGRLLAAVLAPRRPILVHDARPVPAGELARIGIRQAPIERVAACRTVVLAVNAQHLEEAIASAAPHLGPGSLLVDVCSVKSEPARLMRTLAPEHTDLLGTHPLFGPQTVREQGLAGQTVALCPVRIDPQRLDNVRRFLSHALGLRVVPTTPEEHDREMASVQVVTHMVGHAAIACDLRDTPLATLAFRRLLAIRRNVEGDSEELFAAIQSANPFAAEIRRKFADAVDEVVRHAESA